MSPNTFFDQFAEKRQGEEISNFWQKYGITLIEKMKIFNFLLSIIL